MRQLDKANKSMTKILEGHESNMYMPPIFDVYSVKEMKIEEAN